MRNQTMMVSTSRSFRGKPGLFPGFQELLLCCLFLLPCVVLAVAKGRQNKVAQRAISFQGQGVSQMQITKSPGSLVTLEDFLEQHQANSLLLGSSDVTPLGDDHTWACRQPSFTLFGLQLVPVFHMGLSKSKKEDIFQVVVSVLDSYTEVIATDGAADDDDGDSHWLASIMERSTITGKSIVTVKRTLTGWDLSTDFSLTMALSVPKCLPLPPGFAYIGSAVMRFQCQHRARQNLLQLRQAYVEWAERHSTRVQSHQLTPTSKTVSFSS